MNTHTHTDRADTQHWVALSTLFDMIFAGIPNDNEPTHPTCSWENETYIILILGIGVDTKQQRIRKLIGTRRCGFVISMSLTCLYLRIFTGSIRVPCNVAFSADATNTRTHTDNDVPYVLDLFRIRLRRN